MNDYSEFDGWLDQMKEFIPSLPENVRLRKAKDPAFIAFAVAEVIQFLFPDDMVSGVLASTQIDPLILVTLVSVCTDIGYGMAVLDSMEGKLDATRNASPSPAA